jgi:hypothetical protein
MIVYISNPKNSTREFQNLINNLSAVAGYKLTQINQWPFSTFSLILGTGLLYIAFILFRHEP